MASSSAYSAMGPNQVRSKAAAALKSVKHLLAQQTIGSLANAFDDPGAYASVVVSSFGGVRYDITETRQGVAQPFFMLFLCVPLFIAQLSIIAALRMDLNAEKPFYDEDDAASMALLRVKVLMVIVLYFMNYHLILNSIRTLLFLLNPLTWVEVRSYWPSPISSTGWMRCFTMGGGALWAVLAVSMRLAIGYFVCVDSVSVILNCTTASDAIFNSLAITFIIDLSKCWWDFCASIFHLSPLEDFAFEMEDVDKVWTETGDVILERAESLSFPNAIHWLVRKTKFRRLAGDRSLLCRSFGFRKAEGLFAFFLLFLIYSRQFHIVLFAVDTNVLPVARDICTQWRLHEGKSIVAAAYVMLERFLVIDIEQELTEWAQLSSNGNCIGHGAYHSMKQSDKLRLWQDHWPLITVFHVAFGVLLVVTQIGFLLLHLVFPDSLAERLLDQDEEQEQDITYLQQKQQENEERFQQQAEMLEKLTAELNKLKSKDA